MCSGSFFRCGKTRLPEGRAGVEDKLGISRYVQSSIITVNFYFTVIHISIATIRLFFWRY